MGGHHPYHHDGPIDQNSETVDQTETDILSEMDPPHHQYDGSYHQYNANHPQQSRPHSSEFEESKTYVYTERDENTEHHYSKHSHRASPKRDSASSDANSFEQVIEESENDLDVYDQVTDVDEQEINGLTEKIPERNQDRLLSGHESEGQTFQVEQHEHDQYETREHHQDDAYDQHPETEVQSEETVGPPPSFAFRTERLSRNVADAMATIWDRFWADDVRQIVQIIKNRFGQLMPYIRRFIAHLVAFWGGITYIRRALAAFIRVLNKDQRVRELLERVGWASASTLRVFLSMCAMIMSATLQFYHLMRDRVIPDTRRVIPIIYYKFIVRLLQTARRSPWSLMFGPFSMTFAIDEEKIPNKYFLHEKLSVPQEDVTFASFHDIVESVRDTVYRTRYMGRSEVMSFSEYVPEEEGAEEQSEEGEEEFEEGEEEYETEEDSGTSTPVYTQSTDEAPLPPPSSYIGPKYRRSSRGYGKENAPLTEVTNNESGEWSQ